MIDRRIILMALGLGAALTVAPAAAFETRAFDAGAFDAARQAGRPILVEVSAPWCPTCRAQKPILAALATNPRYKDLLLFEVDFDSQKEVLRRLNVRQQSTLIAFKGAEEVGRSVGDTDAGSIEALVDRAL